MGKDHELEMTNKRIIWLMVGLCIGIVFGSWAARAGTGDVCGSPACVDSANVIPVTDQQYLGLVEPLLADAKESIHIVSFEMKYYESHPSSSANLIVRKLIYAKERGLDVRIVTDEYSKADNAHKLLAENGVPIRLDGPKRTSHAKLIIIDGKIVVVGSTNLSHYGIDMNGEANVIIHDEEVAQYFEKYFEGIWGDGAPPA